MVRIFGTEIPPAGRFVQGAWVPAKPEEYRTQVVVVIPGGGQIPDPRAKRFALHGVFSANRDTDNPLGKVCLGVTDDPEEVPDLIRIAEQITKYGAEYFHRLELLDAYQGLGWMLECPRGA
jgi:hypothetical protein